MEECLKRESERLERTWTQREAAVLADYLVAGVEDPRLNLQSIFSRHFIVWALEGERHRRLMEAECQYSAVMNWLVQFATQAGDAEALDAVRHALATGSDNAEGTEIPRFVLVAFKALPCVSESLVIPNYIESFLTGTHYSGSRPRLHQPSLEVFGELWRAALASPRGSAPLDRIPGVSKLTVLEPACGSANDYRFLESYGIAQHIDYTGLDLCTKNVSNARARFPQARFDAGNVFEMAVPDRTFELCFVHDLFEHLSPTGLKAALHEICRVTHRGLCAGFFNMDEIAEHKVRPLDEYHWNTLSLERMKEAFAAEGFESQVFHVGGYLRQRFGCEKTHNPEAYTFWCCRD